MSASSKNILCRYHYDPLDRLTGLTPLGQPGTQRFYQNNELVNEIDSEAQLTIVRNGEQPLAQRLSVIGVTETTLLATDQQRSPLTAVTDADLQRMAYTAYGHRTGDSGLSSLLGFNGERPEPITGHYLLGQGNRAFNPVLMRFNSPDELSPFGDGGINAYAYCGGDPVNWYDPSGNILQPWVSKPVYFRPWTDPPGTLRTLASSSKTISRPPRNSSHHTSVAATSATDPSNRTPIAPSDETRWKIKLPPEGKPREKQSKIVERNKKQQQNYDDKTNLAEDARYYDKHMQPHSPSLGHEKYWESYYSHKDAVERIYLRNTPRKDLALAKNNMSHALKRLKQNIVEITFADKIERLRRQ
ncbi:RHS repeat-associated core domain-containing protein [Pseudomonas sp. NFACC13-1]|uniref:RHS repeat-associated core domain-containing protein n=1 Tax=Pseudomonas sp. NFACC13-1 TaxID=1566245 RepID=UPI00087FBB61|nr:RHS repeat-associated core domain-containing protein [Pseudomonas sp. NFACC13-1]SDB12040.1 RHS repeat-associated core domain-containing protein [Pseudomonas sp. NFACC13-1]